MVMPLPFPWSNWLNDRTVVAMRFAPRNKSELIEAVEWAVCGKQRLRAVGSGHSHSNAALPRDAFIDMSAISGAFEEVKWLKDSLPGVGRDRVLADMDGWGYTFRLGSARAYFEHDSDSAWEWLHARGLADAHARTLALPKA